MKKLHQGGFLRFLSEEDLTRIHEASLEVLEDVGIATDSDVIMDIFSKAGALVDKSAKTIKFPRGIIETSLKSAPRSVVFYGRSEEKDFVVEDKKLYFGLGGSATPQFRDLWTGDIRIPTKKDVVSATLLGDALDNIDFVMSLAGAYDCPAEMHYLHEYDALLTNTSKHIVYSAPSRRYAALFLEMAAAVVGGETKLKERPIVTLFAESQSPLCINSYSEGMIEFAKFGAPILFSPSPMMGATSPVTLSGTLVICNAETLAGICLAQIIKPGAPVIYGPHTPVMDAVTARSTYAATEQAVARAAVAQLAQYYDLPSWGTGGGTDSKCPDSQAGSEITMNIFTNALAGLNLSQGAGTMASGSYGCMEMAYICNEIIGMAKRSVEGIVVDDESLALDVIAKVGPGGHFLDNMHTARLFKREQFIPKLFNRQTESAWSQAGKKRIDEVAVEKVKEILVEHKPQPIPDSAGEELNRILLQAQKELVAV